METSQPNVRDKDIYAESGWKGDRKGREFKPDNELALHTWFLVFAT